MRKFIRKKGKATTRLESILNGGFFYFFSSFYKNKFLSYYMFGKFNIKYFILQY